MFKGLNFAAPSGGSSPKKINPILIVVVFGVVVIFTVIAFSSDSGTPQKKSRGYFNADLNIPAPPEQKKIQIEGTGEEYISKNELDASIRTSLKSYFEQKSMEDDQSNSAFIRNLTAENQKQIDLIRAELDLKNEKLEQQFRNLEQQFNNVGRNTGSSSTQITTNDLNPFVTDIDTFNSNSNVKLPGNGYDNTSTDTITTFTNTDKTPGNSSIVIDNFNSKNDPILISSNGKINPGFLIGEGINAGTTIKAILQTGCISSSEPSPVLVSITEDVQYKDKVIIPKGTNILGVGVSDYGARKIFINLNRLVLGNREIDIKAHLVNKNGTAGFCSKYIDKTMEKFWPIFSLNFAAGILNAFKDVSYFTNGNSTPIKIYDENSKNAAIDGVTSGVTQWSNLLMQDAKAQGAIIVVKPNINVLIYLDEKILINKFKNKY